MANDRVSQMAAYWEQQQAPQLDELKRKYAATMASRSKRSRSV